MISPMTLSGVKAAANIPRSRRSSPKISSRKRMFNVSNHTKETAKKGIAAKIRRSTLIFQAIRQASE